MVSYTTRLDGRDPAKLKLKSEEARELATAGFRFSIYDESAAEFRLSIPYSTAQDLDRGTLTFMQQ